CASSFFFTRRSRLRLTRIANVSGGGLMRRIASSGVRVCAVVVVLMTGARSAFGQPAVSIPAVTAGATIGAGSTGNALEGGARGTWLSAHIDLPLAPTFRVRLSAGA